jgi:hypothetical protein
MPQSAKCVYESGLTGFDLQRKPTEAGVECCVGAVSKMLRPSGDRVKADKRDAVFLTHMLVRISDSHSCVESDTPEKTVGRRWMVILEGPRHPRSDGAGPLRLLDNLASQRVGGVTA